jgi:hypothetical protein
LTKTSLGWALQFPEQSFVSRTGLSAAEEQSDNSAALYRVARFFLTQYTKKRGKIHCNVYQIYPNWNFIFENIPSGNPGSSTFLKA